MGDLAYLPPFASLPYVVSLSLGINERRIGPQGLSNFLSGGQKKKRNPQTHVFALLLEIYSAHIHSYWTIITQNKGILFLQILFNTNTMCRARMHIFRMKYRSCSIFHNFFNTEKYYPLPLQTISLYVGTQSPPIEMKHMPQSVCDRKAHSDLKGRKRSVLRGRFTRDILAAATTPSVGLAAGRGATSTPRRNFVAELPPQRRLFSISRNSRKFREFPIFPKPSAGFPDFSGNSSKKTQILSRWADLNDTEGLGALSGDNTPPVVGRLPSKINPRLVRRQPAQKKKEKKSNKN